MTAGHQSVLLREAVEALAIKGDGIYVDCTFGRGGHSQEILKHLDAHGRLIAIDKDFEAIDYAKKRFAKEERFSIVQASFAALKDLATQANIAGFINGILLDLGVSSPQLDNPLRGFSFIQDGPLDMRMDPRQKMDAAMFINTADEADMVKIFKDYGEERFAGRIARAIVLAREIKPFTTTTELAEVVKKANPKWEKHKHPATRVFQAIRIHINQELSDLTACLHQVVEVLAPGGRLAVISFHSLEDRIVKQFMRDRERGPQLPIEVPVMYSAVTTDFKRIGKAVKPQQDEVNENVRARSAVLRIGEKRA